MTIAGRVVWVTGASSGIGRSLAQKLSRRGADLVLSAPDSDPTDQTRLSCAHPERHLVLPLDLADMVSLEQAAEAALRRFGHIDILINNAGIGQRCLFADTPLDVVRRIMDVNFFGAVALTKLVLPSMLRSGSGRIVVISSLAGKFGTPFRCAYSASKHALHGFFESLRAEVHSQGIRVTIVCPGFVNTGLRACALTGDGSVNRPPARDRAAGMDAGVCAEKIIRAIESDQNEIHIGGRERLAVYLKRFFPGLFDLVIRKARVT